MNQKALKTIQLTKSFSTKKKYPGVTGAMKHFFSNEKTTHIAVNNFDLEINKGEIVGLLGPNGAGKTTLMKMFTGIIVPTSGSLEVLGHKPFERNDQFKKKISLVMGQKSQLWWDIPAMDSFLLLQKYYEVPQKQFEERMAMMGELLDVKKLFHIHIRKLSLGERMKLELMASLLHNPEIIFLDEPTIGLDLVAQENIRQFILDYHHEHKNTIIITSHYMADVHALCKRLVLIFEGKNSFDGPIDRFEKILGQEINITLTFLSPLENSVINLEQFHPIWNKNKTKVELRLPELTWKNEIIQILTALPVAHLSTDKLPVEKVMTELMKNPQLLNRVQG